MNCKKCKNCGKELPEGDRLFPLGMCDYCRESIFPPREAVDFRDMLSRNVMEYRFLLLRMIPEKKQKRIVELFNDDMREQHENRLKDLKEKWNRMEFEPQKEAA